MNSDDSLLVIAVRFLCVSITPFGVPVVPDVKISDASTSPFVSGRPTSAVSAPSASRSSSSSTGVASGVPPRISSARRSTTFADITASFAFAAVARLATSPGISSRSSGTTTAPARMIAKYAMPHSGRFSLIRITRSPAATPRARSTPAPCHASVATSPYVYAIGSALASSRTSRNATRFLLSFVVASKSSTSDLYV